MFCHKFYFLYITEYNIVMDTIAYLKEAYGYATPIFLKEIRIGGKSKTCIRQELSRAVKRGDIIRKGQGVYCFKSDDQFIDSVTFEQIIEKKFIRKDYGIAGFDLEVFGYYTGYTFLNMLGITEQVPAVIEVATNNTSCKRRYKIKNRSTILYCGKIKIDRFNYKALQFFDAIHLLTKEEIKKNNTLLSNYINKNLSKADFEKYIGLYPLKVIKAITEGGFINAFR